MVWAAALMREQPDCTVGALVNAVGYQSESAFGRVFCRFNGVSPARHR